MPTTSNFGWTTPADTDLVKDGAAAIRTLGNGIDTSFLDLKGGTTGQVLSKASNTDLDFSWVAVDPLTILDAKGDLISATAADTPARLAVGTNGQVLTADSTTSTGLKWASADASSMTQLATGTLTGTTVTISAISGSYKNLQLVIRNYKPTTDNKEMNLRINSDTTASRHAVWNNIGGAAGNTFGSTSATITSTNDNSVALGLVIVNIWDYANTSTWKHWWSYAITTNATTTTQWNGNFTGGVYNQTGAITSLQLLNDSGDFTSGDYILYGVK